MTQAQVGVDPVKGFQKGDTGTVLTTASTISSAQIIETDIYTITAADATTITVQESATTTNPSGVTTTTTTYYRPGMGPSPTPAPSASPSVSQIKIDEPKMFRLLADLFSNTMDYFGRLLSRISVQPSTAVGESVFRPWTLKASAGVNPLRVPAGVIRLMPLTSLSPTGSPSPSPSPAGPTVTSDSYYRLVVNPDTFLTQNCVQISNCTVNSTNIQFEEILGTSDGQSVRLHWSYEFSATVPGLFTLMDRCWSQVVMISNVQTVLTQCDNDLEDFRWGIPPTD
jgi:hypothetical protein